VEVNKFDYSIESFSGRQTGLPGQMRKWARCRKVNLPSPKGLLLSGVVAEVLFMFESISGLKEPRPERTLSSLSGPLNSAAKSAKLSDRVGPSKLKSCKQIFPYFSSMK
jgi:hypothetical protein